MENIDIQLLKSYADTEEFPLVICDMNYKIRYINYEALKRYERYGGEEMIGRSLNVFMDEEAQSKVDMVIEWFKEDTAHNRILAVRDKRDNTDIYMCALRNTKGELIGFCSRHRSRKKDENTPYKTID